MSNRLKEITELIQDELGVNILSKSRREEYVFARAIYYSLCDEFYPLPTTQLAESIGVKSHATVLNSRNETFPYMMTFPYYEEVYLKIKDHLKGGSIEPHSRIKILEQEVDMLRKEVDRLRLVQMNMPHTK